MFRFSLIVPATALLLLGAASVAGCGGNDGYSSANTAASPTKAAAGAAASPTTASANPAATATTAASTAASPATAANPGATPTTAPAASAATAAPTAVPPTATAAAQGGTRVNIVDFGYGPDALTAKVGQPLTLTVVNGGQAPHTFTITGVADTGTMSSGQSRTISFTPSAAGELKFFCAIHGAATMSGKVTVTP